MSTLTVPTQHHGKIGHKAAHGHAAASAKPAKKPHARFTKTMLLRHKALEYCLLELYGQFKSISLIALHLILFIALFYWRLFGHVGETIGGIIAAIAGLAMFLIGLKGSIMPLAEAVGRDMSLQFQKPLLLLITFIIGTLTTYAEPAVGSLSPVADSLDFHRVPYLYWILKRGDDLLVLSMGLGVGCAAVIGTLRFVYGFSLRPVVFVVIPTAFMLSFILHYYFDDPDVVALAWDCGSITTGPLTVPLLLALGVGSTSTKADKPDGAALDGLGLIAQAASYPIVTVQLFAIIVHQTYSKADIVDMFSHAGTEHLAAQDRSPLKEVVGGFRSFLPLCGVLVIVQLVLLRQALPRLTWTMLTTTDMSSTVKPPALKRHASLGNITAADALTMTLSVIAEEAAEERRAEEEAARANATTAITPTAESQHQEAGDGLGSSALRLPKRIPQDSLRSAEMAELELEDVPINYEVVAAVKASHALTASSLTPAPSVSHEHHGPDPDADPSRHDSNAVLLDRPHHSMNDVLMRSASDDINRTIRHESAVSTISDDGERTPRRLQSSDIPADFVPPQLNDPAPAHVLAKCRRYIVDNQVLLICLVLTQLGLIVFNWGLTYGYTYIGTEAGTLLPATYKQVAGEGKSPLLPKGIGFVIVIVYIFALGIIASKAEPGLNVMAAECKRLTKGEMKRKQIIFSVAIGFAAGITIGVIRLQMEDPPLYYLLVLFSCSLVTSLFASEEIMNLGWDSGGVTTGPVTVPFVILIGTAFAQASNLSQGFGILGCSSSCVSLAVMGYTLLNRLRDTVRGGG